jgi:trimethylamine--corrinoid protein Co-methyltransferase
MTLADVENCARLADRLPEIGMVGIEGTPMDVNPTEAFQRAAAATLQHSNKPFHFTPETAADNQGVLQLILSRSATRNLASKPSLLAQHTPQSPLCWPTEIIEPLLANAEAGMPVVILSAPYSGVSGPYPLAGQLALMHAEVLSGVLMAQMARPGTPVVWGSSCATFDMATLQVSIGSPEATLLRIGGAQLARHCRLPAMTTAPDTDSHVPDSRGAWEKMHSLLGSLAAGVDLVCNGGLFSTGATACPEQILLDAEMFAVCRRILRGVTVTPDTLGFQDTLAVPHAGSFLEQTTTLRHLRSGEHTQPRLARDSFEAWTRRGSRDALAQARVRVRELLKDSGAFLAAPTSVRSSDQDQS